MRCRLAFGIACLFVLAVFLLADPVSAATITVNNPAPGTGASGDCTLAEAIQAANTDTAVDGCAAGSGADIIMVPKCDINILAPDHVDPTDGPIGMPDITTDITLIGQGSFTTVISNFSDFSVMFSVFRVAVGGILRLQNLGIQEGFNVSGGGVVVRGMLTTSSVEFRSNEATSTVGGPAGGGGGAIVIYGGASATLSNSSFFANISAQQGGAIFSLGTLTVTNTSFTSNRSSFSGGAVEGRGGTGTFTGGSFFSNIAGSFGGGVHYHSPGTLMASRVNFSNNTAGFADGPQNGGGAIEGDAMMRISECLFSNNAAQAVFNRAEGGAVRVINGDLQITASLFNSNLAVPSGGSAMGFGGGVAVLGSPSQPTIISNSTFFSNVASFAGGGGGAIYFDNFGAPAVLNNLTIANNFGNLGALGGGLYLTTSATMVRMRNTILATNAANNGFDCFTEAGASLLSDGHNILGDSTGCSFMNGTADQVGGGALPPINPRLDSILRNRTGFTSVLALLTGSPAIDAGDPGTPGDFTNFPTACEGRDQRLVARPVGTFCDIGAFEGMIPQADLSVTKIASASTVQVGTSFTYTITVMNSGPQPATNVMLNDGINSALTLGNVMTTQGTCSGNPVVSCSLGTIPVDGMVTITITASPNAAGSIFNFASVTLTEEDPNTGNNSGFVSITSRWDGDLRLIKTGPFQIARGNNMTYSLTVTNLGSVDATNVVVTDTLPAGVVFVSGTPTQGTCGEAGGVVTCNLGTIGSGVGVSISIVVTVPATATVPSVLTNMASVTATEPDPFTANNSATVNTNVRGGADLVITKVDSPDPVSLGGTVTFTITVTNNGPDTARNVRVFDTLDSVLSFVSVTPTGGSCTGTTSITCNLGDMANGATVTITIVATVSVACDFFNSANVVTDDLDPNGGFASSMTTVSLGPAQPDLVVGMMGAPDPVTVGGNLIYTINLSVANGPATFAPVIVTDVLPAGVTFNPALSAAVCTEVTGTVTCNVPSVDDTAVTTIQIAVVVNAPGTILNMITAVPTPADANAANNSAIAMNMAVAPPGMADLVVTKMAAPDPVTAGGMITYTIDVFNAGPDDAPSVVLTDILAAGLTLALAPAPSQGTCSGTTTITCDLGTIPTDMSATVTILVTTGLAAVPSVSNTASATTPAMDPNLANNSSTATTQVNPPPTADLAITIVDSPDPVNLNSTLTYTVTVTNNGPDTANNVVVNDNLNPLFSLTGFMATPSQGSCVVGPSAIVCSLGALNNNSSATVTITAMTPASPTAGPPTLTNTVTVSANEADPNAANNMASATTTVGTADVSVSVTGSPDPAAVGTQLTYTVVVANAGPDTASVSLAFNQPAVSTLGVNLPYVSATPTQGSCTINTSTLFDDVNCNLGLIPGGSNVTVTLVLTVTPAALTAGMVSAQANVTSFPTDPNPGSNIASASTMIIPGATSADLSLTKADSPDPVAVGANLTYAITVRNNGPDPATGIVVRDTLPGGVNFVSATGCANAAGTVTCNVANLANGAMATFNVVVSPTAVATLTNTASVTGNESDPSPNNNSATATTMVVAVPFTISTGSGGSGAPQTIDSGQTAVFPITITPNSVPLVVSFDCVNPAPDSTCFFKPPVLVFNDLTPQTVEMDVTTTVCVWAPPAPQPWTGRPFDPRLYLPLLALVAALLAMALRRGPQRRLALARVAPAVLLVGIAFGMAACASGPSGAELRRGLTGTIPGTYTITVNARTNSGGTPQTVSSTVTLVVRQ